MTTWVHALSARYFFHRHGTGIMPTVSGQIVQISVRHVVRAVEHRHEGQPGYLLEGARGHLLGWTTAAEWRRVAEI